MIKNSNKNGLLEKFSAVNHAFARREADLLLKIEALNIQLNHVRNVADASEALAQTHLRALTEQEHVLSQAAESARLELNKADQKYAVLVQDLRTQLEVTNSEIRILSQQLQAKQDDSRRLEQDRAHREKEHAEQISRAHQEVVRLLHTQTEREQEVSEQLLAIHQLAYQEKAEQARNHSEQERALHCQHAEREQAFTRQLLTAQQEFQRMEQDRAQREKNHIEQINEQLRVEREACRQLRQALHILQSEITTMRNGLAWRLTAPFRKVAISFKPMPTQTEGAISASVQSATALVSSPEPSIVAHDIQGFTTSTTPSEITSMISNNTPRDTKTTLSNKAPDLITLLQYQGQQFVEVAYQTLLQRHPDPEGLNYYLRRLSAGVSKLQILGQMLDSSEARTSGVVLPGLRAAVIKQKLTRLPLVGNIFKFFLAVEGNSALEVRLRAVEQQIYRLGKDTHTRLEGIEQSMSMLQRLTIHQAQAPMTVASCDASSADELNPTTASIDLPATLEESKQLSPRATKVLRQLKLAILNNKISQGTC